MNPELPHDPAAVRHILSPWLLTALPWALILAAALLLLWWLHRRKKTRKSPEKPAATRTKSRPQGFSSVVDSIRKKHTASRTYREGCHALAEATRSRIEQLSSLDALEMTVVEIEERLADRRTTDLLDRLRSAQFGKESPGNKDFTKLCDTAKTVLGKRRKLKVRR